MNNLLTMRYIAFGFIAILFLISIALIRYQHHVQLEKEKRNALFGHVHNDLTNLVSAVELFFLDNRYYPSSFDELLYSSSFPNMDEDVFNRYTTGPWGRDYIYEILEDGKLLKISALGEDGSPKNIIHTVELVISSD